MWTRRKALPAAFAGALIVVALAMLIDRQSGTETAWLSTGTPSTGQLSAAMPVPDDSRVVSARERAEALARAQVWQTPKIPIGRARFGADRTMPSMVECRFRPGEHQPYAPAVEKREPRRGREQERQAEGIAIEAHRPLDIVRPHGDLMNAADSHVSHATSRFIVSLG